MINQFSSASRVWVYMSNRALNEPEVREITELLQQFCTQWAAHGNNLKAHGEVLHGHFVVLMVDETAAGASGCSIDKSVHFIQSMEDTFDVQFFNRMLVGYMTDGGVGVIHASEVSKAIAAGKLNEKTLVFNTLVQTKVEFDERFIIALKETWLSRYLAPVLS